MEVLFGMTEYNQMEAELELLKTLAEAEDDVENGRTAAMQDTFANIRKFIVDSDI